MGDNFGNNQFLNNPYMDNSPIKQRFPISGQNPYQSQQLIYNQSQQMTPIQQNNVQRTFGNFTQQQIQPVTIPRDQGYLGAFQPQVPSQPINGNSFIHRRNPTDDRNYEIGVIGGTNNDQIQKLRIELENEHNGRLKLEQELRILGERDAENQRLLQIKERESGQIQEENHQLKNSLERINDQMQRIKDEYNRKVRQCEEMEKFFNNKLANQDKHHQKVIERLQKENDLNIASLEQQIIMKEKQSEIKMQAITEINKELQNDIDRAYQENLKNKQEMEEDLRERVVYIQQQENSKSISSIRNLEQKIKNLQEVNEQLKIRNSSLIRELSEKDQQLKEQEQYFIVNNANAKNQISDLQTEIKNILIEREGHLKELNEKQNQISKRDYEKNEVQNQLQREKQIFVNTLLEKDSNFKDQTQRLEKIIQQQEKTIRDQEHSMDQMEKEILIQKAEQERLKNQIQTNISKTIQEINIDSNIRPNYQDQRMGGKY